MISDLILRTEGRTGSTGGERHDARVQVGKEKQHRRAHPVSSVSHLGVIGNLAPIDAPLDLDRERHVPVDVVDQSLEPLRPHVELVLDVGTVHPRLQALDLPPDVGLGLEQVAPGREFRHRIHLLVRADDGFGACLHHEEGLAERPWREMRGNESRHVEDDSSRCGGQ
jgi:hypothetical protein